MSEKKTSWGAVASWYDEVVSGAGSYQKEVILPNLLRIVDPKPGLAVLDIACGQGFFSHAFAEKGADVIGADISKELIKIAEENGARSTEKGAGPEFHVAPSDELDFVNDGSVDTAVIVLALQNIENFVGTIAECSRTLKKGGRLVIVLNHPAFRIPKSSSWANESGKTYRRIDSYMSESRTEIDMSPGEKDEKKKKKTISFHHPLQAYFKAFNKASLAVVRLEEWISEKKSQPGPNSAEEDRMRKEFPMFLCLEARKW